LRKYDSHARMRRDQGNTDQSNIVLRRQPQQTGQ